MVRSDRGILTSPKSIKAVKLRKQYPEMTLQQIGNKVGLTRQGVSIVLVNQKLAPGHHLYSKLDKYCPLCGVKLTAAQYRNIYCSLKCFKKDHNRVITCVQCNKQKLIRKANYERYNMHFCSRKCHGAWLGQNYGFGVR